jgi:DsbC/DsbD-like thiol-disulfide interchange protein
MGAQWARSAPRGLSTGVGLFVLVAHLAAAQTKPPRAEVTPIVQAAPVEAGSNVTVTLKVRLPAEFHVQSDKPPRDPFLIPTALTVKPPTGIVVDRLVYPKPTDLAQAGRKEPLAVFGGEFTIDVRLSIAPEVAVGAIILPAQLRYQACDDKVCYAPARADVQWTLRIVPKP